MSDTPRTGALLESILRRDRFLSDKNAPEEWVVHARQLERELAVANRKIQQLIEAGDNMAMWLLDLRNLGADEIAADHWMKAKEEKAS